MGRCVLALLVASLSLPALAQEPPPIASDIGGRVVDAFARPVIMAFDGAASDQAEAIEGLCSTPSGQALETARDAFRVLVPAWGRVSVLRFGPLQAENRFERMFFWPDPRGVTLRQVQSLLAEEDQTATDPATLAEKSVALQGLPAIEFLLFGGGSDDLAAGAPYRCAFAQAVARNAGAIAAQLRDGWADGTPFHTSFVAPAVDSDPYRSTSEVAGELVKALSTALQFIRAAELLPAYGETAEDARGKRAPFWRGDLTFDFVAAQVDGMIGLLEASGFLDHGDGLATGLASSIRFELRSAKNTLYGVEEPAEIAFESEADRGRIGFAMIALEGANHTLGEQFSAAIGLTMGFNALDGD
jgi:predicted lipoprotein